MKVLGVIPARGGSKGIPRKNIKMLAGKPLIQYTIDEAFKAKCLAEVIVTTDDEEIASVAKNLGADVPFMRPQELAGDTVPTIDVLLHVVNELEKKGRVFDAVCLLQPTTPFRKAEDIGNAIEKFMLINTDSLISVLSVPHEFNPHWTFEPDENGNLKIATGEKNIITRRQDLPKAFFRDGAIYITRISIMKSNRSLYGETIGYYEMDPLNHVNIDTVQDWDKAEKLLLNR